MFVIQVCSKSGRLRNSINKLVSTFKSDDFNEADLFCRGLNCADVVSWRNRYVVLEVPVDKYPEGGDNIV